VGLNEARWGAAELGGPFTSYIDYNGHTNKNKNNKA
jgi:hypothetical protein